MKNYLEYPWGYKEGLATEVNNGCGPEGWKGKIIPDTIYGISIKEACKIHDYEYFIGKTLKDKERADKRFLKNMKLIFEHKANCSKIFNPSRGIGAYIYYSKILNTLRGIRAYIYYKSVVLAGREYFEKAG